MLDTTEYEEYMGMEGIKISQFPITSSPKKYSTETESRETLKWDTVIKKEISHNAISLKKPFIVVHALDRETDIKRVKYSVAVTVEAVGYAGDLYQEIVNEYPLLTPIRIRQEQHVEVPNIRTY